MDDAGSSSDDTDPIAELLISYDELNSPHVDELDEVPSALEFMRYVARNRPFVIRGGASDWEATKNWNVSTLKDILKGGKVNVAVTPKGNADSPTLDDEGQLVFVKPWEEEQSFEEFLTYVTEQELSGTESNGEVRYAQTQNDNLRGEYLALFSHVKNDISWARIALQQDPEAINLWIGNSKSVTAMHKDNYENIYCQIIGQKHFLLLPPLAEACVAERELQPASYVRLNGGLEIKKDEGESPVPFCIWDADVPSVNATKYSHLARPLRVTLNKGDMLYLPALWFHKVSQSCSDEGLCLAVNYWSVHLLWYFDKIGGQMYESSADVIRYDMDYSGSFYPLCNFARSTALSTSKR